MTEAETRIKSEGSDEESIAFETTASEAPQVEASAPVAPPGIPRKEAAGSDSNAEPPTTMLVKVTEQASTVITNEKVGDKVDATDEQKKGSIPEMEEGRKDVTIECEKGSTPSTNTRRRLERKKKVAGNDNNAEPSRTVPVKVEEQASAIMIMNGEDKAREGQAAKGETVEGTKEGVSSGPARRIQKRKKVALPVATTSAAATAEITKDNEEKSAVADEVESALGKEDGGKEDVLDERKKATTLGKKAKRLQKRKTVPSAVTAEDNKEKTDLADSVGGALSKEEGNKEVVLDGGEKASTLNKKAKSSQEMETKALTIATNSAAITAETANDEGEKAAAADKDKADKSRNKKNKRKNKNKTRVAAVETAGAAEVESANKLSVTKEHAGMIFMCSAETKRDCYRYKVFGMPAGKKEAVAKVYKGMKLFLYDIDLKLLYGIYIATSKGGYNIQPKAFKSAFPSQVRFKALKDYLPLPEEKFKAAIKANYYQKKKFNLELSAEQVNKLSKLFIEATKASKRTNDWATGERSPQNFASRETKRRRFQGAVSRPLLDEDDRIFPRSLEGYASQAPLQVPFPPPGSAVPWQAPLPSYSSPRLPPLPPQPVYVYERPREFEYYSRELPMEAHGYRVVDSEMQVPYDHAGLNDPYGLHREPGPYHETRYPLTSPPGYHVPAPPPYRY